MPPRSWRFRLDDILEAASRIADYLAGCSRETFLDDAMLREAVAYNLIVIGEAAAHLPQELLEAHPDVPWPLMRGMRNVLAHQYFSTDAEVIWNTATQDLPPLVEPICAIRDDASD